MRRKWFCDPSAVILLAAVWWLVSGAETAAGPDSPAAMDPAGYQAQAHAHNNYMQARPLLDALDNGFSSVEADIWLVDGDIVVGHDKGDNYGTLRDLYLEPLQKRVSEKGTVHADGKPFFLWLDIKDGRDELRPVLQSLLQGYRMITRFADAGEGDGAVTVILTGDAGSKEAYGNEYTERYACRDSNVYRADDPPSDGRWTHYALRWPDSIRWYAESEIEPETLESFKALVRDIHAKGRKVRFYAAPETEFYWKAALQAEVDFIGTDRLPELRRFLEKAEKKEP